MVAIAGLIAATAVVEIMVAAIVALVVVVSAAVVEVVDGSTGNQNTYLRYELTKDKKRDLSREFICDTRKIFSEQWQHQG